MGYRVGKFKLTEASHLDELILVLLALFAALTLAVGVADCAGIRAVWWTDALLCGAFGVLGALLFIGSKLD